jgi:hypothetical protein
MQTFPMTHYKFDTKYPDSSAHVQLGRSWTFTAAPSAPDQRTFTLSFTGMKYYQNTDGTLDSTTNASVNNVAVLEAFYQSVQTWDKFQLNHPVYGTVVVQFQKPLVIPKGVSGGFGTLEDFTIDLLEQP